MIISNKIYAKNYASYKLFYKAFLNILDFVK